MDILMKMFYLRHPYLENNNNDWDHLDILINNAANNPSVRSVGLDQVHGSRMEAFPLEVWNQDIAVGLTGVFPCARTFGEVMSQKGKGVILNITSDLALISPDQRLYRKSGLPEQA